jgi:hypothetical protein
MFGNQSYNNQLQVLACAVIYTTSCSHRLDCWFNEIFSLSLSLSNYASFQFCSFYMFQLKQLNEIRSTVCTPRTHLNCGQSVVQLRLGRINSPFTDSISLLVCLCVFIEHGMSMCLTLFICKTEIHTPIWEFTP